MSNAPIVEQGCSHSRVQFSSTAALPPTLYLADCIINIAEFEFSIGTAQPTGSREAVARLPLPQNVACAFAAYYVPATYCALCGVGIYVASRSFGAFQRREPTFERHIT